MDLVVAVSIGAASAFFVTGAAGEISAAPMATLPLLLISAVMVPIFIMLHTAALPLMGGASTNDFARLKMSGCLQSAAEGLDWVARANVSKPRLPGLASGFLSGRNGRWPTKTQFVCCIRARH